ncbi:hypothetical protein V495_03076 [Pseudogymnoascus sp. VKM F-4514 (FW-929)]|nr:hypothetical protein V495_03076 [Pseudogymnoascus sp. VKM F-4514 (FW-929)]KFY64042.1 hypothetical protein V497_01854 [Pseudogymnoascus sp. VKM F-4516 (FW-969)]
MARIFHNPAVREDAAPNANSEVDTASPKTAESVSTRIGQVFTKILAAVVCEQAWQYMNSYPGEEARGCNISYHSRFGRLAQGIVDCEDSLERQSDILCYRLSMIKLATEWKDCLGLPMVDAHLFDVIPWFEGLGEFTEANTPWLLYSHLHYQILRANIFDRPVGTFYSKPADDESTRVLYITSAPPNKAPTRLGSCLLPPTTLDKRTTSTLFHKHTLHTMASSKRARCETESPIDAQFSTNGSGDPKKPKTANGTAGSSGKPRPPINRAEEQELNRLDQREYKEIMDRMVKSPKSPSRLQQNEYVARRIFWARFYAMGADDFSPERRSQTFHPHIQIIIAERRKSCPWYIWGLEGHVRNRFPDAWAHVYKDGEDENAILANQVLYPWDEPRVTTSNSSAGVKSQDKKGLWDLPSNEMEKSIGDIEIQLSKVRTHTEKKKSKVIEVRKETEAKIDQIRTEANQKIERLRTESENQIDTLQLDISDFELTIREKQTDLGAAPKLQTSNMETQPPPSRKRKRPDSQDAFEEEIANLSLEDFPTPPGVKSFGGRDGQKFGEPRDAASTSPANEDQIAKKRAPISEEERNELYKLDLAYFQILHNAKKYEMNDWPAHAYWCRRKFWEHYYRTEEDGEYPEYPEPAEKYLESLREGYANNHPPWWFPGFRNIEPTRTRYPKAWKHYENGSPQLSSAPLDYFEAEMAREDVDRFQMMTDEQLEEAVVEIEAFCASEREKIRASKEVADEYSHAIKGLKREYEKWQDIVDNRGRKILRIKEFMEQRRAGELAEYVREPMRKKRRMT